MIIRKATSVSAKAFTSASIFRFGCQAFLASLCVLFSTLTQAAFVEKVEHNSLVYIISDVTDGNGTLHIYNLNTETSNDVILSGTPTAIDVDDDGIYIAFGRRVASLDSNGANEVHLFNTLFDVVNLLAVDNFLLATQSEALTSASRMLVANKSTGAFVSESDIDFQINSKLSYFADGGKLAYINDDVLTLLDFTAGTIGAATGVATDAVTFTRFEEQAQELFVHPDGDFLLDFSGNLASYDSTAGLGDETVNLDAPLAYLYADVAFMNNNVFTAEPITDDCDPLRGGATIRRMSDAPTMALQDGYRTTHGVDGIAALNDKIYIFHVEVDTLTVEIAPLTSFSSLDSVVGPILSPLQGDGGPLNYYFADKTNNILYFLYTAPTGCFANIYRFNLNTGLYLDHIALTGTPDQMTYSSENNIIYLGYDGDVDPEDDSDDNEPDTIRKIVLDSSTTESDVIHTGADFEQLVAFGNFLLVSGESQVIDSDGNIITAGLGLNPPGGFFDRFAWDESTHTYTYGRLTADEDGLDVTSISFDVNTGAVDDALDTSDEELPASGVIQAGFDTVGFEMWPLDDGRILIENGLIIDSGLNIDDSLNVNPTSALWLGGLNNTFVTLSASTLRLWDEGTGATRVGPGLDENASAIGSDIIGLNNNLMVVVDSQFVEGFIVPFFRVFDNDLNPESESYGIGFSTPDTTDTGGGDSGGGDSGGSDDSDDDSGAGGGSSAAEESERVTISGSGASFLLVLLMMLLPLARRYSLVSER